MIRISKPTVADLDKVVEVERASWPDIGKGMVADPEKLRRRIERGLLYLAHQDEEPVGIMTYQLPNWTNAATVAEILSEFGRRGRLPWQHVVQKYGFPKDWYEATDNGWLERTHDPNSDVAFLVGVSVRKDVRGQGIVNQLIQNTLCDVKQQGKKFAIAYGRLPQLATLAPEATLECAVRHLLHRKPDTDLPADYGARFHQSNGATLVSVIPNSMDDPESLNFGFLPIYRINGDAK